MPTAEILSQGDEVITGQIVDSNAAWLSDRLTDLGLDVVRHTAVGDRLEIIHPQGNRQVLLEKMFNLDGEPVQVAQGSPVRVRIPLTGPVDGALIARLLQPS